MHVLVYFKKKNNNRNWPINAINNNSFSAFYVGDFTCAEVTVYLLNVPSPKRQYLLVLF